MKDGACPLGKQSAYLHWRQGLTWNEVKDKLKVPRERARSAARAYKKAHPDEFPEGGDRFGFSEKGNYATTWSASVRVKTLAQLLEETQTDLSVWKVKDHEFTKWEVGAKPRWADLHFDEGRITGHLHEEGLQVEPLWRVRAHLVRIKPLPLHPVIKPVECATSYEQPKPPSNKGILRSLIFTDPQIGFSRDVPSAGLTPFHDRRALDLVLQIAEAAKPDRVDILGDYLDFVMWTDKFLRSPKFEYTTQPAICEGHWWLAQLRAALPQATIKLHEGNHDFRMRAAIMTHLRAAYGLRPADEMDLPPALSPQRLLALHRLGIEWIGDYPKDADWLNDRVQLLHGNVARSAPGDTAKAIVRNADSTKIFGHAHRVEWVSWTEERRDRNHPRVGFCPGCTCRIDWQVPGHKPNQRWQQGMALVDYEPDGEMFGIAPILIDEGRAMWDGKRFEARDRMRDLGRDLPDWNWAS